jgi:hypothetical protein
MLSEPGPSTPTPNPSPEMHSTIQFQEIPIGQFFEYRGRRYRKLARSMASDEDRNGNIFQAQTEVLPDPLACCWINDPERLVSPFDDQEQPTHDVATWLCRKKGGDYFRNSQRRKVSSRLARMQVTSGK